MENQIQQLRRALNTTMRKALIDGQAPPTTYYNFLQKLLLLSSQMESFKLSEKGKRGYDAPAPSGMTATAAKDDDEMDWEATAIRKGWSKPQTNTGSIPKSGKRAPWVTRAEIERRKEKGQCLRCGKGGHFIGDCKLRAARRPSDDSDSEPEKAKTKKSRKTRSKKAKPEADEESTDEDIESEGEQGKE
jgi:hypothetical protein